MAVMYFYNPIIWDCHYKRCGNPYQVQSALPAEPSALWHTWHSITHVYWTGCHQNKQMVQMCPVRANIDVCVQNSRTPYCMLTPAGQCANQNKNHWCGQTTISMPVCHHSCLQAVSIQRKGCQNVKGCSVLQYSFIKEGFWVFVASFVFQKI